MALKALMYHYVRSDREDLPYFKYLHIEDFRGQLDWLAASKGFADRETFMEALEGGPLPDGVVLTFDDGFADHHDHVLPELEKRGLWGIFYVPTGPLAGENMLDVHRVHLLLGRHDASIVAARLRHEISDDMIDQEKKEDFRKQTYMWQRNPDNVLYVKRMLNYFIRPEYRRAVLDELMRHFFGDEEKTLSAELYMKPAQVRALHEAGMIVGSHTVSHPVMSRLPMAEQEREIADSVAFLENLLEQRIITFCYPYGGKATFTDITERLLTKHGIRFSFAVEPRDITANDLRAHPQALPRYDCNMFPHGQCRN